VIVIRCRYGRKSDSDGECDSDSDNDSDDGRRRMSDNSIEVVSVTLLE